MRNHLNNDEEIYSVVYTHVWEEQQAGFVTYDEGKPWARTVYREYRPYSEEQVRFGPYTKGGAGAALSYLLRKLSLYYTIKDAKIQVTKPAWSDLDG